MDDFGFWRGFEWVGIAYRYLKGGRENRTWLPPRY